MIACNHSSLELLPEEETRMRCRRCHLTISKTELQGSYCPECFAGSGAKYFEFDELEKVEGGVSRYRCEKCGVIVTSS
jgi:predicted RNA-binding Zn-ribbon protein involved in translation (DUF1610 family)